MHKDHCSGSGISLLTTGCHGALSIVIGHNPQMQEKEKKFSLNMTYQWVSLVGWYCVRPRGAWGLIPQYCRLIFCITACLPGLTWPGQKVPGGDVISNPESLDSLPKADWWHHPNVTQRWRYIAQSQAELASHWVSLASSLRKILKDHTVHNQPDDGCGSFEYIRLLLVIAC